MSNRDRSSLVPNANNPRLLLRVLAMVAAGIRRPRALAEVLEIEIRTVHYYTQACEWLGLLSFDQEVHLTERGMELAFAEPHRQMELYGRAVWSNGFAQGLLQGCTEMPERDAIATYILQREPTMSSVTARRRASSVYSLLEPAMGLQPASTEPAGRQLSLPFLAPKTETTSLPPTAPVDLSAGVEHNPDIYCRVLNALLDNGELRIGQLRALLDRIGARNAPIGAYTDLAVQRGDAIRVEDRLVIQPAGVQRESVALDGVMVAFSDPEYRSWLDLVRRDPKNYNPVERRDFWALGNRFAAWDLRVFGSRQQFDTIDSALERVLSGRSLDLIPVALPQSVDPTNCEEPFIDCLDKPGMMISFPQCLGELAGGVTSVNAVLRRNRAAPAGVRLPSPVDSRAVVHGGVLYPGEIQPRAFADNLSLRLRTLTHTPTISLLGALLVLDRRHDAPLEIQVSHSGPMVQWSGNGLGPVLPLMHQFATSQGWIAAMPRTTGLTGLMLEALARALGIATRVGHRLLLDEALFLRLQDEPEARMTYDSLLPLVDRWHTWLTNFVASPGDK
jgi:hypothetical protein